MADTSSRIIRIGVLNSFFIALGRLSRSHWAQMNWAFKSKSDLFENLVGKRRIEPSAIDHVRYHRAKTRLRRVRIGRETPSNFSNCQLVIDQENFCFLVVHNVSCAYRCKRLCPSDTVICRRYAFTLGDLDDETASGRIASFVLLALSTSFSKQIKDNVGQ